MTQEANRQEMEVARQREWHRRAQAGDRLALDALYRSMLPLLKSRVRRVFACYRGALGGWYELDDLIQDAYVVFHRFVMTSDPQVPLYRLIAGAFESALRSYLHRRGPLRPAPPIAAPRADGDGDEPTDEYEGADGAEGLCGEDLAAAWACARELLDALPSDGDRQVVTLAAAGFTAREAARQLDCTVTSLYHRRRRIRAHLARRGLISGSRRTA